MITGTRWLLMTIFTVISCLPEPAPAADGPENTGSLMLSVPAGDNHAFEAQLQIDRNVLRATFGDEGKPQDVLQLFSLSLNDRQCTPEAPALIPSEDVVTAALRFQCTGSSNWLTITLNAEKDIPQGFTLGVRTPFDHFVLSRPDRASVETITSGPLLFYRAGLDYFTGGLALEHARVGRAHALYYGGLTAVPSGVWLLLLILAVWCCAFSVRVKVLLTVAVVLITGTVAAFVMEKQASLSLIPVRTLGFIYLGLIAATGLATFISKEMVKKTMQLILLTLAAVASGLEHAVILRWLEGQDQMSISALTGAFFLGTAAMITTIVAISCALFFLLRKARNTTGTDAKKHVVFAALPLLILPVYPALAMLLKWI